MNALSSPMPVLVSEVLQRRHRVMNFAKRDEAGEPLGRGMNERIDQREQNSTVLTEGLLLLFLLLSLNFSKGVLVGLVSSV